MLLQICSQCREDIIEVIRLTAFEDKGEATDCPNCP
jgi:hypothetical protein